MDEVRETVAELGLPVVVRPSFTMGGLGSGMAYSAEDVERMAGDGLAASPSANVLIEESIYGWKEFELELMRDHHDNVVVVCSIENFDPMGVHTGDSVTVAPAMTLTDREYQTMRDLGIAILREVGVDTGGCNIQFAVDPADGRLIVIEMNPRVSRSSALASKATGFPIAKIAAKLAIGYTLDEIVNDITKETPACFEPTLDYVVVKAPRFAFEKFPGADATLTTTMKSVGEAMSLGRNFIEALGKVMRSLETSRAGFWTAPDPDVVRRRAAGSACGRRPTAGSTTSSWRCAWAPRSSRSPRPPGSTRGSSSRSPGWSRCAPSCSTRRCSTRTCCAAPSTTACPIARSPRCDRNWRARSACGRCAARLGIHPVYKTVDTCAAEFEAKTPYHYSSYELDPAAETEVAPQTEKPKVLILGSGPNRIGQGIEFDYSCVHAATTLSEAGFETVMINCNPETVSTDYDTADRLYFEPLTFEDVLEVYYAEQASGAGGPGVVGVIVQLGGQTPLGPGRAARGGGRADRRHQPQGHRPRRGPRRVRRGAQQRRPARAAVRHGHQLRAGPPDRRRHRLPGAGPAVLRARRARHGDRLRRGDAARATSPAPPSSRPNIRCSSTASSRTPSRSTSTRCATAPRCTSAASWSTSRRRASTPATRRVRCRRSRWAAATSSRCGAPPRRSPTASAWSACSTCSTRSRTTCSTCWRPTRAPAAPCRSSRRPPRCRWPRRARESCWAPRIAQLREEGVLARTGDGASVAPQRADRGQGSGAAVPPVPQGRRLAGRFAARPGDEVDRRGDGHRPRLRQRLRQEPDRGLRLAAGRGHRVRLGGQPGQALAGVPGQAARRPRLPGAGHRGNRGDAAPQRHSVRRGAQALRGAEPESRPALSAVDAIRAGEVDMVINTPYGNSGPRIDGYEIRSAAVSMNIPCVTTVQGASAAVQGIEAGIRGDIGVMSLQELHSALGAAVTGFGARLADGDAAARPAVPRHRPAPRTAAARGVCRVDADGLAAFCDICVEAFAGFAVVKPQVAFFEAYGAAGFAVLERTIAGAAGRRGAGARRRQARRHRHRPWRPTPRPGPVTRRWPPTR